MPEGLMADKVPPTGRDGAAGAMSGSAGEMTEQLERWPETGTPARSEGRRPAAAGELGVRSTCAGGHRFPQEAPTRSRHRRRVSTMPSQATKWAAVPT